ncbi:MAG: thiamine-phosphate kinase, partial [Pseudomonadota bacterium]
LAAKGAEPFAYLLTLALGPGASTPWVRGFADGLRMDNALYGVDLLGGDTLRASPGGGTTVAITAFGRVPEGKVVRRRTARPGEVIAVTGVVGDAALGLRCRLEDDPFSLSADHREALLARYLLPEPPVAAWPAVRAHASAAMDVSDGLLGDLLKLASAAGVAAIIDIERVPHSPAVRAALASGPRARDLALTGGDDYQVLATMPAHAFTAFRDDCARDGAAATVIGEIKAGAPAVTVRDRGTTITVDDSRFQHF